MLFDILAAASVLILSNGQELKTDISLSNPTRIVFEDDRPTQLIFNETDQNAPSITATLGSTGDVFISVERGAIGQKIVGFITTESKKTYPVSLSIRAVQAPQVTIASAELRREAEKRKAAISQTAKAAAPAIEWTRESSYTAALSRLIVALYHNQEPEGFMAVRAGRTDRLADGLRREEVKVYKAANVKAATYKLTNEQDYSQFIPNILPDLGPYLALSYTRETLAPGESAFLYQITKGAEGE